MKNKKQKVKFTPHTWIANIKWEYESPDKGKTLYRRPFGLTGPKELIFYNLPVTLN